MTKEQTDNGERLETTLGELLHRTRTAQQKTLEDAAQTTRIHASFLRALEENDFEKLPAEIFTRGFIRLYATYLGLDPHDTFQHYLSQERLDAGKLNVKPYRHETLESELLDKTSIFTKKKSCKVLPVTILLAILVIFYIIGVFSKSANQFSELQPGAEITSQMVDDLPADSGETAPTEAVTAENTAVPASPPPLPAAADEGPSVPSPQPAKQQANTAPIVTEAASPPAEEKSPQPTPNATVFKPIEPIKQVALPITVKVATDPGLSPKQTSNPDADFKYVLEATFAEDSLVRIRVDDKPQLQYKSQAGIVRIWKANESIVLNLDNSAGVSLTLNGIPLPITDSDGPTATVNIPADMPRALQP